MTGTRRRAKRTAPSPSAAARFSAVLLEGHKGTAVEVPFDPAERWTQAARALRPGRRGHWVRGTLEGVHFTSAIVPRSGRFWLLVDEPLRRAAGVRVGATVRVTIDPLDEDPPLEEPPPTGA
jgi:hypothetical protein